MRSFGLYNWVLFCSMLICIEYLTQLLSCSGKERSRARETAGEGGELPTEAVRLPLGLVDIAIVWFNGELGWA